MADPDANADSDTDPDAGPDDALRAEARAWFEANWDPDQPLKHWWAAFAASGWANPAFPTDWFGRGLTAADAAIVDDERRRAGAAPPPATLGPRVIAPLLVEHGSDAQKATYLLPTISGQAVWCELFSEPGAGSDLASLATRAVRTDQGWRVNGQKVWTSGAPIARWGLLTARTDPDRPKRDGLTCFLLDMRTDGVDTRPLRAMTGDTKFSEVFLTDVLIPGSDVLGHENEGWALTRETLALERRSLGRLSDNHKPPPLERRAGDLAAEEQASQQRGAAAAGAGALALIRALQREFPTDNPVVRQDIARLYCLVEVSRHMRGSAEATKLLTSRISRTLANLALQLEGPHGTLSQGDAPLSGVAQRIALSSPSMSIMIGTDEIQKNVIGERILGLPPEPSADNNIQGASRFPCS